MKALNRIVFFIALLIFSNKISAKSYKYVSNGFKLILEISQKNDSISCDYAIYNLSKGSIYYSPKCLIVNNFSSFLTVELGSMYYSMDASHTPVVLRKLELNDSAKFSTRIKGDFINKEMVVAFDCFVMDRFCNSQQKKILKSIRKEPALYGENLFMDYSYYYKTCIDWFVWNIGSALTDK